MVNRQRFQRRYLYTIATSKSATVLYIAGLGALVGGLVAGAPLVAFGGGVGLLVNLGIGVTRFLNDDGVLAQATLRTLEKEDADARDAELDALERALTEHRDVKASQLLRTLRELARPFQLARSGANDTLLAHVPSHIAVDIASNVDHLFLECERTLRKILALAAQEAALTSRAAKTAYRSRTAALLAQVEQSVTQLSSITQSVQSLGSDAHGDTELARVQQELQTSLDIARRVDEHMTEFVQPGYDPREFEKV